MVVNIDTGVTEDWLRFVHTLDERYGGDAIKMIVRPEQAAAGA